MDTPDSVVARGFIVDLPDLLGQECAPDRTFTGPSDEPGVVAHDGDTQDAACSLDGVTFNGHRADGRESLLWGTDFQTSSIARFVAANPASSAMLLRLAAASSPCSVVDTPGTSPRSIRSWRVHV